MRLRLPMVGESVEGYYSPFRSHFTWVVIYLIFRFFVLQKASIILERYCQQEEIPHILWVRDDFDNTNLLKDVFLTHLKYTEHFDLHKIIRHSVLSIAKDRVFGCVITKQQRACLLLKVKYFIWLAHATVESLKFTLDRFLKILPYGLGKSHLVDKDIFRT